MLIGISPELEIALYTLCYKTRPGRDCWVSLGGDDLLIQTIIEEEDGALRNAHFRLIDH